MRGHRVRFTPPRKLRATKRRFGQETFLHSPAGWTARMERAAEQYQKQNGTCRCGRTLTLAEAKFESKVFREGEENQLTCPDCQKQSKS